MAAARSPKLVIGATDGISVVPASALFRVTAQQHLQLPLDLLALPTLDEHLTSAGVLGSLPAIEPGFAGIPTFTLFNAADSPLDLPRGGPLALLRFYEVVAPKRPPPDAQRRAARTLLAVSPPTDHTPCQRHRCTACCWHTEMPLTEEDLRRLQAAGHSGFSRAVDGWQQLQLAPQGHCVFLGQGGCTIYDDRPEGCRLYPVVFDPAVGAVLDEDCPYPEEFPMADAQREQVAALVERLLQERKDRILRGGVDAHRP